MVIVIPIMAAVTAYILWYHVTRFKRRINWIHKTFKRGVLGQDDLPWIWMMLGMPDLAARAEGEFLLSQVRNEA